MSLSRSRPGFESRTRNFSFAFYHKLPNCEEITTPFHTIGSSARARAVLSAFCPGTCAHKCVVAVHANTHTMRIRTWATGAHEHEHAHVHAHAQRATHSAQHAARTRGGESGDRSRRAGRPRPIDTTPKRTCMHASFRFRPPSLGPCCVIKRGVGLVGSPCCSAWQHVAI
jgi:hypothetical protein